MSVICGECERNVENPYYLISLGIYSEGKLAQSDQEVALCNAHYDRIRQLCIQKNKYTTEGMCVIVDGVTGGCGGLTGSVQLSSPIHDKHGLEEILSKQTAEEMLPRIMTLFRKKITWVEKDQEREWTPATWAHELYDP